MQVSINLMILVVTMPIHCRMVAVFIAPDDCKSRHRARQRAIRYHGFWHPAAKANRERIAFHTGRPLLVGAAVSVVEKPPHVVSCPCCGEPMAQKFRRAAENGRGGLMVKVQGCGVLRLMELARLRVTDVDETRGGAGSQH